MNSDLLSSVGSPEGTTGTILVVDDDEFSRSLLRELLESEGHRVFESANGLDGVRFCDSLRPDVVLLDVMMPGMDGFETAKRLKSTPSTAPIPIILITALSSRDYRLEGISTGATDFITKPIDNLDTVLRVRNAVSSKKQFDRVQQALAQLMELEKLRDDFSNMIVHDLRAPIAGIVSFLELLGTDSDSKLDRADSEYLSSAMTIAHQLLEMVSSILDVNRLASNELPMEVGPVDLESIVSKSISEVAGLAEQATISIVFDTGSHLPPVCADPDLLRRVLVNLLTNALKFAPAETSVEIAAMREGTGVEVSVIDKGPGIPAEHQATIFDKFSQVSRPPGVARYSTGLGLAFCKLVVEAHGGNIGVQSEVDLGSTFWFTLPLATVQSPANPTPPAPANSCTEV